MDKKIYIIHENDEWVVPLREELKKINAPMLQPKARRAPNPIKKPPRMAANKIL